MYTVRNLQERYGVSEATALGWIKSGELKAFNVGRKAGAKKARWRITQAALDAFELARTQAPQAARARRPKPTDVVDFYP